MTETLLGVIIGGLIAAIPSIVSAVVTSRGQKARLRQDLKLKQVDLIDAPRLENLREYAYQLGAYLANVGTDPKLFSRDRFAAAHARAAALVSPETLRAMNAAYPIIVAGWPDSDRDMTTEEKLASPELNELMRCLKAEMVLTGISQDTSRAPSADKP